MVTMNKLFSFLAGALCGALVGSSTALLLTPASGSDLKASLQNRIETAMVEGKRAMEETQKELEAEFERMKRA